MYFLLCLQSPIDHTHQQMRLFWVTELAYRNCLVSFTHAHDTRSPVGVQALLVLLNPCWPGTTQLERNTDGGKPTGISYLSSCLFRLLNGSGIKHDLSASPLTVLVHYQANVAQVQLRT